jgi:hypothetical protein
MFCNFKNVLKLYKYFETIEMFWYEKKGLNLQHTTKCVLEPKILRGNRFYKGHRDIALIPLKNVY